MGGRGVAESVILTPSPPSSGREKCYPDKKFDFDRLTMTSATMVLILDGNSEIGAHVWSNFCYFICVRHSIKSRVVINRIGYFSEQTCGT